MKTHQLRCAKLSPSQREIRAKQAVLKAQKKLARANQDTTVGTTVGLNEVLVKPPVWQVPEESETVVVDVTDRDNRRVIINPTMRKLN